VEGVKLRSQECLAQKWTSASRVFGGYLQELALALRRCRYVAGSILKENSRAKLEQNKTRISRRIRSDLKENRDSSTSSRNATGTSFRSFWPTCFAGKGGEPFGVIIGLVSPDMSSMLGRLTRFRVLSFFCGLTTV
jgi:hypothetical protein